MKVVSVLLCALLQLNWAQPADSLAITKNHYIIDSLLTASGYCADYDTIFFAAEVRDARPWNKYTPVSSKCSSIPLFYPELTISFDISEYAYFQTVLDKTFDDSLRFLNNNGIVENWYRIYQKRGAVIRTEQLGKDIHVDFGMAITSNYYSQGKLILFIDEYCKGNERSWGVAAFSYSGSEISSQETFVILDGIITGQRIELPRKY